MADVNDTETLAQLIERRRHELGDAAGPLSWRDIWRRAGGEDVLSYETIRRIGRGTHTNIGDVVADALAVGLDVPASVVIRAAGQLPRLGRFQLPRKADRLNDRERKTVLAIVDTILEAHGQTEVDDHASPAVEKKDPKRAAPRRIHPYRVAQDDRDLDPDELGIGAAARRGEVEPGDQE